ncbi:MAG: hypothetical protein WAM18_15540 [Halobacillus sp.]|uniref:hypothetical protein n=1 Tax=Halobacillus sp. TaxID=56800 RepID=UPI003BB057C9
MRQISISISLIFLGLCIVAGAWMVSNALNSQNGTEQVMVNTGPEKKQLMGHLGLKSYLGINDEQLEKILPKKEGDDIKSEIPYIQIGYEYYFPVKAIDKWLTETEAETFK